MSVLNSQRHHLVESRAPQLILNGLLWALWLWLFRPIFPYLATIFTRYDFRSNQIALMILVAVFAYKAYEEGLRIDFGRPAQIRPMPLALMLTTASAFVGFERFLDINNLSAALFVAATYGLVGLYVHPQSWRNGLPVMLLVAGTLPVNHHIETFIGYPMRIASAALVGDLFAAANIGTFGVNTILVFENGVAHVDSPCSGVKSLWTGSMFLMLATWLEGKRLGWRWIVTAILLIALLFASNLIRIALLVLSGQVMGWHPLAEMLHVPLGVLGFVGACLLALALLREWVPTHRAQPATDDGLRLTNAKFTFILIAALLLLNLANKPYVRANASLAAPPSWAFPAALDVTSHPLNAYQLDWLVNDGADSAERFRFKHGELSGSMLFVLASNHHAHHFPENCFAGSGMKVTESRTVLVQGDFPIRWLTLTDLDGDQHSAAFWFQSAEKLTDDYAARIWDDLRFDRNEWVLVSTLFDGRVDVNSAETAAYLNDLRTTAQDTLEQ